MKTTFILIFIVLIFTIVSCKKTCPHIERAYILINDFSKEQKFNGLYPFGVGGYFHDGIEKFTLDYVMNTNEMDIDTSREIIVRTLESFFLKVNTDQLARPFLINYPYDEKNIYFVVLFMGEGFSYLKPPNITSVTCAQRKIFYEQRVNGKLIDVLVETYAEAYEKVFGVSLPENRFNVPYDQHRTKQVSDD